MTPQTESLLTSEQQRLVLGYVDPCGYIWTPAGRIAKTLGLTKEYVDRFVRTYNEARAITPPPVSSELQPNAA